MASYTSNGNIMVPPLFYNVVKQGTNHAIAPSNNFTVQYEIYDISVKVIILLRQLFGWKAKQTNSNIG